MTLEEASVLAQVVSAVAVIASMIFVGIQLRQATRAVHASSSQAHSALYQAIVSNIIENGDFARIWRKALIDFASCSPDDRVRFVGQASALFQFYESARVQWLNGQLDPEHWYTIEQQAISLAAQPGIKTCWKLRRHWHSRDFQRWFDDLRPASAASLYGAEVPDQH